MCIYFQFHLVLVNVERVNILCQWKDREKMNCLGHSIDVAKCQQKIETSPGCHLEYKAMHLYPESSFFIGKQILRIVEDWITE